MWNYTTLFQQASQQHKYEMVHYLNNSFTAGSRAYKVSYHTQQRWLKELMKEALFNFNVEMQEDKPFALGIDEASFAGTDMVTTIGNVTYKRLKGILSSKNKQKLKKLLQSPPQQIKGLINEVVIDMSTLYLHGISTLNASR